MFLRKYAQTVSQSWKSKDGNSEHQRVNSHDLWEWFEVEKKAQTFRL